MASDSTRRFSDRVADYVRYRPGYPAELGATLRREAGLGPGSEAADVGSGTGISAELLLAAGATVHAVEPNPDMRRAAEERLGDRPGFHSVDGTAEATTLPEASVELVTAGQAFHWFDHDAARSEFARILRPAGRVALFWNARRTQGTPFLRAYEELLQRFGTDYRQVDHTQLGHDVFSAFFAGPYRSWTFPNHQVFDFDGLRGRLLSSSYTPAADHPDREPMLRELRRIFERHQDDGRVRFDYDTELHLGRVT